VSLVRYGEGYEKEKGWAMAETDERVRALREDAAKVMDELGELSKRLAQVGKSKAEELGGDAVADLAKQLETLRSRVTTLTGEGKATLAELDKSVRANPYVYIMCALGLGMLLGKARRP
jgi:ElaB/YqjD/DUF883 family membrane-anchored ribosome-binding protein